MTACAPAVAAALLLVSAAGSPGDGPEASAAQAAAPPDAPVPPPARAAGSPGDELEAIAAQVGTAGAEATRARLAAFAAAHPGSDEGARALLLVGQLWRKDGRDDLAGQAYQRVVTEAPASPSALDAELGLGDLALTARDWAEAARRFERVARVGEGRFLYQARLGLELASAERLRYRLFLGVAAALVALSLWRGARARTLWPPPEEVLAALPVAGLLLLASLSQPDAEARAVRVLALGGLALLWANAAAFAARPPRGARRLLEVALGLGQAAGLLFCAIIAGGLWTRFVETLSVGAE